MLKWWDVQKDKLFVGHCFRCPKGHRNNEKSLKNYRHIHKTFLSSLGFSVILSNTLISR